MADRVRVDCRKYPSEKGCTVAVSGTLEEVVELAWLHAKMHHDHRDNEEKDIKEWIRANVEPAHD
jgi:predicted small metal-binding protein